MYMYSDYSFPFYDICRMHQTEPQPGPSNSSPKKERPPRHSLFDSVRTAAFVLGTALVVFAAARNTVTW